MSTGLSQSDELRIMNDLHDRKAAAQQGRLLSDLRRVIEAGVMVSEVAREACVSRSYVSKMLSGERPVTEAVADAARRLFKTGLTLETIRIDDDPLIRLRGKVDRNDEGVRRYLAERTERMPHELEIIRKAIARDEDIQQKLQQLTAVLDEGEALLQEHRIAPVEATFKVGAELSSAATGHVERIFKLKSLQAQAKALMESCQRSLWRLSDDLKADALQLVLDAKAKRQELRDAMLTDKPSAAEGYETLIAEVTRRVRELSYSGCVREEALADFPEPEVFDRVDQFIEAADQVAR